MPVRTSLLTTTMLSGVVGAAFLPALTAQAADIMYTKEPVTAPVFMPAVDGFNAKVEGFGGSLADRAIFGAKGTVSIPLGGQFGFQLDGVAGSYDSDFFGGVGAHLFWRDPSRGMFGLYVANTFWDRFGGLDATHIAAEAEYYWNRWTIRALAGVETGNSKSASFDVPGGTFIDSYDIKTRFFDKVDLSYYLTDNFKVLVGHRYLGGKHAAALGGEVAFALGNGMMAALFAEGRIGQDDFHGVWGGLKIYFGQHDKSLIQRHRQDDPNNWMPETLFTITNSATRTFVPTPPAVNPCAAFPGEIFVDGRCVSPDSD